MRLLSNRADGAAFCDFHFGNTRFSLLSALRMAVKRIRLGGSVIMPWAYHTAHVYTAMRESAVEEYGAKGEEIIARAANEFVRVYDAEALRSAMDRDRADFNAIPDRTDH